MKLYVQSARTINELSKIIQDRLKVEGVADVKILNINSRFAQVQLIYDDGTVSARATVRYDNKAKKQQIATDWRPGWSISDAGKVINEAGKVIGYFKLLTNPPTKTSPNYLEDSLVVNYGTRAINLTEDSGESVAHILHKSAR